MMVNLKLLKAKYHIKMVNNTEQKLVIMNRDL